jgi:hypothetical protein
MMLYSEKWMVGGVSQVAAAGLRGAEKAMRCKRQEQKFEGLQEKAAGRGVSCFSGEVGRV